MENNTTPPKEIYVSEFALAVLCKEEHTTIYINKVKQSDQITYLSEQSVLEMLAEKEDKIKFLELESQVALKGFMNQLAEKDKEIPKWIPVTTKPEFDGEYLCCLFETEECGTTHIKQRVLSNHFNVWMVKANQSVLFWMPLPKQP
jgi:hypothetical protein